MPCYCDTPDSSDQVEIERRAKEHMYFHAQCLLTPDQVFECTKHNLKQFPIGDVNEHLCKLCHILTDAQMKSISAYHYQIEWKHENLYDWYQKHLDDDRKFNSD